MQHPCRSDGFVGDEPSLNIIRTHAKTECVRHPSMQKAHVCGTQRSPFDSDTDSDPESGDVSVMLHKAEHHGYQN
jgi:hypothetical protein